MNIFEYQNYKNYITDFLEALPNQGYGQKSKLATFMNSQTSYVSRVLKNDETQLTLEQGEKVAQFFGLTKDESSYLYLLIQKERAGSRTLKSFFNEQIEHVRDKRLNLSERLKSKTELAFEDQVRYYGSWIYPMIHAATSIARFEDSKDLSEAFQLDPLTTKEAVGFLLETGIIQKGKNNKLTVGTKKMHLGNDSPMLPKYHQSLRLKAINVLEKGNNKDNLNYSSFTTISREDAFKIKEILIKAIESSKKIIAPSKEEDCYIFNLDFFKVNTK